MFARVLSGSVNGVDAYRIDVEVVCRSGIGQINIVGLPDAAVKEAQDRVRSAITACEYLMPSASKWIINLAPADVRKAGPSFDLPMAVGMLASSGRLRHDYLADFWLVGEVGLDGSIRPISGVLPIAMACRKEGVSKIIVPEANAEEAALIAGLRVYPVSHLKQACLILDDPARGAPYYANHEEAFSRSRQNTRLELDFEDVQGQEHAKRALCVAAAGRHNMLMVGPPGTGKSMLAERLPSILPPVDFDEALELTRLYSVSGLLMEKGGIISQRPFRNPHHSASMVGLVGGGPYPKPGEISLSHLGVLFLDELTEFPRRYLDLLRQPLETGLITICRSNSTITYPANFLMICACNPCPCGYRGDRYRECTCTATGAEKYWTRLSGPFLDRVDLQVEVSRPSAHELSSSSRKDVINSLTLRLLVARAVERQRQRNLLGDRFYFNSQMPAAQLRRHCAIDDKSHQLLVHAVERLGLSARAYHRILRIARTIADLADEDEVSSQHIAEAIRYRTAMRQTVSF
jgi:magnesium chelatase family protein